MVSLINNTAASAVLSSLRQIGNDLATAQVRIGTGKKINSAADNAAVWTIAQGIKSDQTSQDGLSSGIAVAKGKADAAGAAVTTAISLYNQIKTLAQDVGNGTSTDFTGAANKITALKAQITSTLAGATFQGENWLTDTGAAKSVNTSVSGGTASSVSVTTVDQDAAGGAVGTFNAIAAVSSAGTGSTVATGADTAIASLTAYQSTLSTFSSSLGAQQDFLTALKTINNTALSSLLDADLTEESAKVTALQTQQQLAYQALSIGNSSASNILRLFQ